MTDWRSARISRIEDLTQPDAVLVEDSPDGGFGYVPERILVSDLAAAKLAGLLAPPEFEEVTADVDGMADLGLRVFRLTTGEHVPARAEALELAALERAVLDGDDPAEIDVSPDHVVFGAPRYHGDPATAPDNVDARPWADLPAVREIGPATVAVLDTGIAEIVTANVGLSVVRDGDDTDLLYPAATPGLLGSAAGHGTFITGIVQRMGGGELRVDPGRVLNPDGVGWDSLVAQELLELSQASPVVEVVNMSFSGYTWNDRVPVAIRRALLRFPPTTVFVAAAGNADADVAAQPRPGWPAASGRVVAVGSLAEEQGAWSRSGFSHFGDWVDVWTFGERLLSTYVEGDFPVEDGDLRSFEGWARWSGTSFATALVTAELARRCATGMTGSDAWESLRVSLPPVSEAVGQLEGVRGLFFDPRTHGIGLDPREA